MSTTVNAATSLDIVPLFIDGRPLSIAQARVFEIHSPSTNEVISRAHGASKEDAIRAASVAWETFGTWKHVSGARRRDIFLRASELLQERAEEIAQLIMDEGSCGSEPAQYQVHFVVQMLRELASRATTIQSNIPHAQTPGIFTLTLKQPIGPALIIAPWNAALILAARAISGPLIAGCTVVFKASELCPRVHHALVRIFHDAGVLHGALNKIQCDRSAASEVTEALIAHHAIKKVEFIGSNPVGSIIGQLCGKYLKPILMELGGKSAAIVLEDADLPRAAELVVRGAFFHHGQICFSTERAIVVEAVAEKFTVLLKAEAEKIPSAGTAAQLRFAEHAEALIADAVSKGAKPLVGGPGFIGPASARPTILTGVTKGMRISDEETFGPSFSLYVVKDADEAIKVANDSKYGLSATIHTSDMLQFVKIASEIEVGQVAMNSMTLFEERELCHFGQSSVRRNRKDRYLKSVNANKLPRIVTAPLGGAKGSGWGRVNGSFGIEEFLVEKLLYIAGLEAHVGFS
jgi:acyl-CoA reductase-like NAD-dependent aldehyde dehydrogenase